MPGASQCDFSPFRTSMKATRHSASVERFQGVKFYQADRVKPAQSTVLARLNDQTPLVLEQRIGEGKVLIFTSTFDKEMNDLPIRCLVGAVRRADGVLSERRRRRAAGRIFPSIPMWNCVPRITKARLPRCWIRRVSGC